MRVFFACAKLPSSLIVSPTSSAMSDFPGLRTNLFSSMREASKRSLTKEIIFPALPRVSSTYSCCSLFKGPKSPDDRISSDDLMPARGVLSWSEITDVTSEIFCILGTSDFSFFILFFILLSPAVFLQELLRHSTLSQSRLRASLSYRSSAPLSLYHQTAHGL